ncbi:MAG: hypothetical protein E7110_00275 [Bacteroidales bacterium]|nr:hypothetical protein [Bacteroidales bacterium]
MRDNNRVWKAIEWWENASRRLTLEETFFAEVKGWDKDDLDAYFEDCKGLLDGMYLREIKLTPQDSQKFITLRENITGMHRNRESFPANFYEDSNVYKYAHRSCSNCFYRPTCALHRGKDWNQKWVDNGRAGCMKYRGPFNSEKRLRGREKDD